MEYHLIIHGDTRNIVAGRAKRCCMLGGEKERKRLKKRQVDTQNVFDLVGTIRRGGLKIRVSNDQSRHGHVQA